MPFSIRDTDNLAVIPFLLITWSTSCLHQRRNEREREREREGCTCVWVVVSCADECMIWAYDRGWEDHIGHGKLGKWTFWLGSLGSSSFLVKLNLLKLNPYNPLLISYDTVRVKLVVLVAVKQVVVIYCMNYHKIF